MARKLRALLMRHPVKEPPQRLDYSLFRMRDGVLIESKSFLKKTANVTTSAQHGPVVITNNWTQTGPAPSKMSMKLPIKYPHFSCDTARMGLIVLRPGMLITASMRKQL